MNVQSIDLGDELRQSVQPRLHLAPVVFRRPVVRDLLHQRERDALRIVRDGLFLRPLCGGDAPAQVLKFGLGHVNGEGADRVVFSRVTRRERLGNRNFFSVRGHGHFLCWMLGRRMARATRAIRVTAYVRSDRSPTRSSSTKSFGCSHAAKWPPLSSLL